MLCRASSYPLSADNPHSSILPGHYFVTQHTYCKILCNSLNFSNLAWWTVHSDHNHRFTVFSRNLIFSNSWSCQAEPCWKTIRHTTDTATGCQGGWRGHLSIVVQQWVFFTVTSSSGYISRDPLPACWRTLILFQFLSSWPCSRAWPRHWVDKSSSSGLQSLWQWKGWTLVWTFKDSTCHKFTHFAWCWYSTPLTSMSHLQRRDL